MAIIDLMRANPQASIIGIAVVISFISLLVTKYTTDQARMKELKARQKELSKQSKEFKDDIKKFTEINQEIMKLTMEMFRHSFKPLLITMIPLLALFWWVKNTFSDVFPHWIWYYKAAGIISSLILRKVLKVE